MKAEASTNLLFLSISTPLTASGKNLIPKNSFNRNYSSLQRRQCHLVLWVRHFRYLEFFTKTFPMPAPWTLVIAIFFLLSRYLLSRNFTLVSDKPREIHVLQNLSPAMPPFPWYLIFNKSRISF